MRKVILLAVTLLVAGSLFAGEGKSCNRGQATKAVELTGTIEVQDGAKVFRVADSDESYSICDKSSADVAKLGGSKIRVTGKLVSCDEGRELMIEKAAKI